MKFLFSCPTRRVLPQINSRKSLDKWSGNERLFKKKRTKQKIRRSSKFTAAITALIIYMKKLLSSDWLR